MSGNNNGQKLYSVVKEKVDEGELPRFVFQIDTYTDREGRVSEDRLGVAVDTYSLDLVREGRTLQYIHAWDMVKKDLRIFEVDGMEGARVVGTFNGEVPFAYPQSAAQASEKPLDPESVTEEVWDKMLSVPTRWAMKPKHLHRRARGKGLDTQADGAITYLK